jgi:predicted dehydrogenase
MKRVDDKVVHEHRWAEQVLAPCIVCEAGERQHRKYPPMPVQYDLEDIDVDLDEHTLSRLDARTVERYRQAREDKHRITRAYAAAISDEAPDVLEYLVDGPSPAKLPAEAQRLIPTPTATTNGIEDA